jgi:hypothetical protein
MLTHHSHKQTFQSTHPSYIKVKKHLILELINFIEEGMDEKITLLEKKSLRQKKQISNIKHKVQRASKKICSYRTPTKGGKLTDKIKDYFKMIKLKNITDFNENSEDLEDGQLMTKREMSGRSERRVRDFGRKQKGSNSELKGNKRKNEVYRTRRRTSSIFNKRHSAGSRLKSSGKKSLGKLASSQSGNFSFRRKNENSGAKEYKDYRGLDEDDCLDFESRTKHVNHIPKSSEIARERQKKVPIWDRLYNQATERARAKKESEIFENDKLRPKNSLNSFRERTASSRKKMKRADWGNTMGPKMANMQRYNNRSLPKSQRYMDQKTTRYRRNKTPLENRGKMMKQTRETFKGSEKMRSIRKTRTQILREKKMKKDKLRKREQQIVRKSSKYSKNPEWINVNRRQTPAKEANKRGNRHIRFDEFNDEAKENQKNLNLDFEQDSPIQLNKSSNYYTEKESQQEYRDDLSNGSRYDDVSRNLHIGRFEDDGYFETKNDTVFTGHSENLIDEKEMLTERIKIDREYLIEKSKFCRTHEDFVKLNDFELSDSYIQVEDIKGSEFESTDNMIKCSDYYLNLIPRSLKKNDEELKEEFCLEKEAKPKKYEYKETENKGLIEIAEYSSSNSKETAKKENKEKSAESKNKSFIQYQEESSSDYILEEDSLQYFAQSNIVLEKKQQTPKIEFEEENLLGFDESGVLYVKDDKNNMSLLNLEQRSRELSRIEQDTLKRSKDTINFDIFSESYKSENREEELEQLNTHYPELLHSDIQNFEQNKILKNRPKKCQGDFENIRQNEKENFLETELVNNIDQNRNGKADGDKEAFKNKTINFLNISQDSIRRKPENPKNQDKKNSSKKSTVKKNFFVGSNDKGKTATLNFEIDVMDKSLSKTDESSSNFVSYSTGKRLNSK